MNQKRAKAIRRLAKIVFENEKSKNNENMKNINADSVLWMENTNRKVTTEEQDYGLVQAFDDSGVAIKNEDGTPKLIHSPKIDSNGEPVMRKVEWAPGTISIHPLTVKGFYRRLKKLVKPTFTLNEIKAQTYGLQFQTMMEKQKMNVVNE